MYHRAQRIERGVYMGASAEVLIDRDDLTLVIIDIQERLAAVMPDRERVAVAAGKLARLAAMVHAPVIVTRQYPEGLGPSVPELEEVLVGLAEEGASVQRVDKTVFCCAAEPDFEDALRATGRRQVVISGMETHICVVQTALILAARGHMVHVAADACCSRDVSFHELALERMRAAGVIVTTSESVMYEAIGRAGTEDFKRLLGIVKA